MDVTTLAAAVIAIGALGTAAFGLVDATKAFGGGISNVGYPGLLEALQPFAPALDAALGRIAWPDVLYAHWINGRPRADQKAIIKSLIRLGLRPEIAPDVAEAGHVDPERLKAVCAKLMNGEEPSQDDMNVLGRFDASVEAHLDAAFDRADQQYRNVSRVLAGLFSVALAFLAVPAMNEYEHSPEYWIRALVVGLLAVPFAPIAKDLASSLSAAANALKTSKIRP